MWLFCNAVILSPAANDLMEKYRFYFNLEAVRSALVMLCETLYCITKRLTYFTQLCECYYFYLTNNLLQADDKELLQNWIDMSHNTTPLI